MVLQALTYEIAVCTLWNGICNAKFMLCYKLKGFALILLSELASWNIALRTTFWSFITFVYISTYWTYPFCHNCCFAVVS